ncbi:MAG TPA: chromosomal replication initiator protein DnaA [Actinomycetota bacterium]|nr:chromosomal replication initiator protein DnaA [Actinomycetota bacterium]
MGLPAHEPESIIHTASHLRGRHPAAPNFFPRRNAHLWKPAVDKGATGSETAAKADVIWSQAADRIRTEVPPGTFNLWFSDVRAAELSGDTLELTAPSDYVRAWLDRNYLELITRLVGQVNGQPLTVHLQADAPAPAPEVIPLPSAPSPPSSADAGPGPGAFPARYTFDSFVLGPSNRFAHAAAMAVAEAPPSKAYNPLFIYGGVGLGKTHLLYAIANLMRRLAPDIRAKYVTSESFVTEFIKAVREGQGYLFQRRYRDVDVLLVDDIQFLVRAEETQTEFFHTFNTLHGAERQIVIASDRPPQELSGLAERLRNRFRWGLIVDIQPPNLETRIAILQQKALRDGIPVPDPVLHFIAEKFDSNIRELEGALLRVVAFASLSRQPVDLALAERALEDLLPHGDREVPAEIILEETARYFSLRREDLVSKSRSRPLTTARHIAMYLTRELTGLSLIKIGDLFDRDHSTALHGIKRIETLMPNRDTVYRQVQELTRKITETVRGTQ